MFTKKGDLRHIKDLDPWGLYDVLVQKYKLKPTDARELTDFLLPMLELEPDKRASAAELINHPWLKLTESDWAQLATMKIPPRMLPKKRDSQKGLHTKESKTMLPKPTSSSKDTVS
jgi:serine/threonine protein kinase